MIRYERVKDLVTDNLETMEMSNEYMDNQLTDVPSAIAELLAVNKQLEQELAKLKEDNEKLKAELFNQKEHYEVLKENYDNVFIFMAEKTDRTITECFDRYKDWLAK